MMLNKMKTMFSDLLNEPYELKIKKVIPHICLDGKTQKIKSFYISLIADFTKEISQFNVNCINDPLVSHPDIDQIKKHLESLGLICDIAPAVGCYHFLIEVEMTDFNEFELKKKDRTEIDPLDYFF